MDLVKEIYQVFQKLNKDPVEYFDFKDKKGHGYISLKDFDNFINDFWRLNLSEREYDLLVKRFEDPNNKGRIDYKILLEDIQNIKKEDEFHRTKSEPQLKKLYNPSTPIKKSSELKFSTRIPRNVPQARYYSMKNTAWGRQGITRRTPKNIVSELEMVLEEIMKETFLNEKLVEDHFKEYSKGNSDINIKEFTNAMAAINLDYKEEEMNDIFNQLKGKEKVLEVSMIDSAVEDTVKMNIEELQKLILDDIYSSIKSDPLSNLNDIFSKFENDATNKITFNQFVLTLEPKCLNIEPVNLYFVAKRYWTKYDDSVYYKDFIADLENKLTKNVDPTKEWMEDIWSDIQKVLIWRNNSIYKFFGPYADSNDRISKDNFHEAFSKLKLDSIYDKEKINLFYYYWDINKSEVVSWNELQKTIRTYCQEDINSFIEKIIDSLAKKLFKNKVFFEEVEDDYTKTAKRSGKELIIHSNGLIDDKLIEINEFWSILTKDFRVEISTVDLDLLSFYYRDKHNDRLVRYDGFLSRLSEKMSMFEVSATPKLNKNISSMPISDDEISRILKNINLELEESKYDIKEVIFSYNRSGVLTEDQFQNAVKDLKINLSSSEVLALVAKYYNTVNKMVYADQLVEDLKKQKIQAESTGKKSNKSSKTIDKVSRHITKNKLENKVIDELYMMDRDGSGKLDFGEIKDAFHKAGIKLSTDQIKGVLEDKKKDSSGCYDYRDLLISMFSYTERIKRNDEKFNKKTIKAKEDDTKRKLDYSEDRSKDERREDRSDDRRGDRRDDRRNKRRESVSSKGSNRSGRSNKSRNIEEDRFGSRRGSAKSADQNNSSRSRSRRDSDLSRSAAGNSHRSGSPQDSSKSRGDPSRSRSRNDRRGKQDQREETKSISNNKENARNVAVPKKSNLKKTEVTEITEYVGSKIKDVKLDYLEVFKTASKNDPDKLISNGQLIEALRSMQINLDSSDKDRLINEIDTQKI